MVRLDKPALDSDGRSYKYVMTYTAFDGKIARLALAVSNDLINWKKLGLAFQDEEVLKNPLVKSSPWTKSGAIVPQKINGEYIMYFGDNPIFMARSVDGLHWQYPTDEKPVLSRRTGLFDSGHVVEPGPAPWVDSEGIHLLYHGDSPPRGYQLGEAVFSLKNPSRVIRRSRAPILSPDQPFEIEGQVGAVVFAEGMVFFGDAIYLYYGAADGKIAVAVAPRR